MYLPVESDDVPVKITISANRHMGFSENSVPLHPMVLLIIIPTKWLFHWGFGPHVQTYPYVYSEKAPL